MELEVGWWRKLNPDVFKRLEILLCAAYLTCKDIDSGDEAYAWPDKDVRDIVSEAYNAILLHNRGIENDKKAV